MGSEELGGSDGGCAEGSFLVAGGFEVKTSSALDRNLVEQFLWVGDFYAHSSRLVL